VAASRSFVLCLLAACGASLGGSAAAEDGIFISSTPAPDTGANQAAAYDSAYTQEEREATGGNTPEADARPGTYYFLEGAAAFRKHDYTFAIQMYEVSASWAYKPAEYNLGVIYARGQGVPIDLPRALAWMALAAERNDRRYIDAREAIYAEMNPEQFTQANALWRDMKKTFGDEVGLRRARTRWAQVRASITGSRVGNIGNLQVSALPSSSGNPGAPRKINFKGDGGSHPGLNPQNQKNGGAQPTGTSSAEVLGGQGVDGTIAYRQLLSSPDPYDPKFAVSVGTATVGKPAAVKDESAEKKTEKKTESEGGASNQHF
jgi:hypothetical protein